MAKPELDDEYLDALIARLETGGPIVLNNPERDALPLFRELRALRSHPPLSAEEREALTEVRAVLGLPWGNPQGHEMHMHNRKIAILTKLLAASETQGESK